MRYTFSVPSNTTVIYCEIKKIIIFIGFLSTKSLKLKLKVFLSKNKKTIFISSLPIAKRLPNNEKKNIKSLRGTTLATFRLLLLETKAIIYERLKLIGIGYRVFEIENLKKTLSGLRLGYSHQIYLRFPRNIRFFCLKLTKLFIFGNSLPQITQEASKVRQFRKPDPYKGKGIRYESEKIKLKEGKKV